MPDIRSLQALMDHEGIPVEFTPRPECDPPAASDYLRDDIAKAALVGIIASCANPHGSLRVPADVAAEEAYEYADAMMLARRKRRSDEIPVLRQLSCRCATVHVPED